MVVPDGPGTETALSVPPAAGQFLPVVGLEVLRSELRQGDGTQSGDLWGIRPAWVPECVPRSTPGCCYAGHSYGFQGLQVERSDIRPRDIDIDGNVADDRRQSLHQKGVVFIFGQYPEDTLAASDR